MVWKRLVSMILRSVGSPVTHAYLSLNFAGAEIVRFVKEFVPRVYRACTLGRASRNPTPHIPVDTPKCYPTAHVGATSRSRSSTDRPVAPPRRGGVTPPDSVTSRRLFVGWVEHRETQRRSLPETHHLLLVRSCRNDLPVAIIN